MKKLTLLLVLVALVAGVWQNAEAAKKLVVLPMTWQKANGSGGTTYDSTKVSIPWTGANAGAGGYITGADTTNAIDMTQYKLPTRQATADSTGGGILIQWFLQSWAADGTTLTTTTDSSYVWTQYSVDGNTWTTERLPLTYTHAANMKHICYAELNRTAGLNGAPPRYFRAIVSNYAPAATALVRWYAMYAHIYTDD